jgi:hypothetical protein
MLSLLVASQLANNYVDVGALAGTYDGFGARGADFQLGMQLDTHPVWGHASLGIGESTQTGRDPGTFVRVALGLETRVCLHPHACFVGGADLGFEHASVGQLGFASVEGDPNDPSSYNSATHAVVIPRVGFEAGADRLKLVVLVEAPRDLGGDSADGGVSVTGGLSFRY